MRYNDVSIIYGRHQSKNQLKSGDLIISNQSNFASYKPLWKIYKEAADELGLDYPETYGYAYPAEVEPNGYLVSTSYCIRGYTQKSLFYIMSLGMNHVIKDVPRTMPIEERMILRHQRIKQIALEYFQPQESERIELISNSWIVV